MISSVDDYKYVTGADIDDDHPHGDLDRIIIDGEIMPLRTGTTATGVDRANILRGEDIAFLLEATYSCLNILYGLGTGNYRPPVFYRKLSSEQYCYGINASVYYNLRNIFWYSEEKPSGAVRLDAEFTEMYGIEEETSLSTLIGDKFYTLDDMTFAPEADENVREVTTESGTFYRYLLKKKPMMDAFADVGKLTRLVISSGYFQPGGFSYETAYEDLNVYNDPRGKVLNLSYDDTKTTTKVVPANDTTAVGDEITIYISGKAYEATVTSIDDLEVSKKAPDDIESLTDGSFGYRMYENSYYSGIGIFDAYIGLKDDVTVFNAGGDSRIGHAELWCLVTYSGYNITIGDEWIVIDPGEALIKLDEADGPEFSLVLKKTKVRSVIEDLISKSGYNVRKIDPDVYDKAWYDRFTFTFKDMFIVAELDDSFTWQTT